MRPAAARETRHVKQPHEPIGLVDRQWPQQHRVDDAEDGGVGADAEREHGDDRDGESRRAEQHAERVAKIGKKRTHDGVSR
jgi:hypothetical protein